MFNVDEYNRLTEGEQSLYNWQFRQHGSFFMALWTAISKADNTNLQRLAAAYPGHVQAYMRYISQPGFWNNILEKVGRP